MAKLESSQAVSQAEQMGRAIVTQIESAIDNSNIGEKLMNKILTVFRSNFSQMLNSDMGGTYNQNTPQAPIGGVSTGYTQTSNGIYVPAGMEGNPIATSTVAPQNNPHTHTPPSSGPSNPISDSAEKARNSNTGPMFSNQPFSGSANKGTFTNLGSIMEGNGLGNQFLESHGNAQGVGIDSLTSRVRAANLMKKIDPKFDTSEMYDQKEIKDKQESLKEMAAMSTGESSKLSKEIEKLTLALLANTESQKDIDKLKADGKPLTEKQQLSDIENSEMLEKIDKKSKVRDSLTSTAIAAERDNSELNKAVDAAPANNPWYKTTKGLAIAGGVVAAAGVATNFVANYSSMKRSQDAGEADLSRFGSRDLMSKNYENIIATSRMGGEKALEEEAGFAVKTKAWGKSILGAAGVGLGGAMSTTLVGALAGVPLAVGSSALIADGYKDMSQIDQRKADYMREQQTTQRFKDSEFNMMYKTSAGLARSSYSDSLDMGSDQYSHFLYGGGKGGILDRSKSSGLSYGQLLGNQRSYAQQMGTVHDGQMNLYGSGVQDSLVRLNKLQGEGFSNASGVAGAFYRGGAQTGDYAKMASTAADSAGKYYTDLKNSGMAEEAVPRLLQKLADQGGSLGSMDVAKYNMGNVAAAGQAAGDIGNSAITSLRADMQEKIMSGSTSGTGVEGTAKAMVVDSFAKTLLAKTGKTLSPEDATRFRRFGVSEQDYKDQGLSDSDSKKQFIEDQDSYKKNLLDLNSVTYGNEKNAKTYMGLHWGVKTTAEQKVMDKQLDQMGSGFQNYKDIPMARPSDPRPAVPGKQEQILDTSIDVSTTASGFKTLGQVIGTLNSGLPKLIESFETLSRIANGGTSAPNSMATKPAAKKAGPASGSH